MRKRGCGLGTRYRAVRSFDPPIMRLDDDVRRCVVFVGHCLDASDDATFTAVGTAFLLIYRGVRFLVTAQHIAHAFGDDPYWVRLNRVGGGSDTVQVDPAMDPLFRWLSHPDENVDLAVAPFNFDLAGHGMDDLSMSGDLLLSDEDVARLGINVGDLCYGVGLFRLLQGTKRNVPIVHTGNIALMPSDEEITVRDWRAPKGERRQRRVRGYVVEIQNLKGLSGSPVIVRASLGLHAPSYTRERDEPPKAGPHKYAGAYDADVYILGVWSASWDGLADGVAANEYGEDGRIPMGLGTVVPASCLIELLNSESVKARGREWNERVQAERAATPDATHD